MSEYTRRAMDSRHLPIQSPIKDDLQQIYTSSSICHVEINAALDKILSQLDGISDRLDKFDSAIQNQESYRKNMEEVVRDHFIKVAGIVYQSNGFDEHGNRLPKGVVTFQKWSEILRTAFWNFLIVGILSTLVVAFYEFNKGLDLEHHPPAPIATEQKLK